MPRATRFTIFLDDKDGSHFDDCTNVKPSADGLTFINGNGLHCITNMPYFVREESANEKA